MTLYEKVRNSYGKLYDEWERAFNERDRMFKNGKTGEEWDICYVYSKICETRVSMVELLYTVAQVLDTRDDLTENDIEHVKEMLHQMVEELV